MTLRKKTLLIIGITLVALIVVLYALLSSILLSGFARVEEDDTTANTRRVIAALNDDANKLNLTAQDWSDWDDTYRFVEDGNPAYIQSNLTDPTFSKLKLNLMVVVNSSGQIVFGTEFDLATGKKTALPESFKQALKSDSPLLKHQSEQNSLAGLLLLPEHALVISARPILNSQGEGPIHGTFIMGHFLDAETIKQFADRTQTTIKAYRYSDSAFPADFAAIRPNLSPTGLVR